MTKELLVLLGTAISIGFFHTLFGPDHYLPFIVMSKARGWNLRKTSLITFLCGLGHIVSSVVLGFIGIALGIAVFKLETIEAARGDVAAWLLIIFGFTYFIWGLHRAILNRPHTHIHHHPETVHEHHHAHEDAHTHVHQLEEKRNITPWILFTIFVFGPCEPLIPILMYPAAKGSLQWVALVAGAFGLTTVATMMVIVAVMYLGLAKISVAWMERYSHALAGLIIFLCGGAIKFLGL